MGQRQNAASSACRAASIAGIIFAAKYTLSLRLSAAASLAMALSSVPRVACLLRLTLAKSSQRLCGGRGGGGKPSGVQCETRYGTVSPRSNEWFNVYGSEDRRPGEWGHWTGRGMNWNSMCATCHNTRLRKNYDAATMWHKVTPLFGRGATYDSWGKQIEVPDSLYRTICQWDQIVFLRNAKKMDLLWRLTGLSSDPAAFERFQALIRENQGFALFQVIEAAKIELTAKVTAPLKFSHPRIPIDLRLTRSEFDQNSADLTAAIIGYLDTFLADSQITPASIETVFLTGGTSLLHRLRQEFITRFGQEKIRDGQEFTSVADGLALSAPLFFPELNR